MAAPCVLVSSCSANFNPEDLIKEILSTDKLPQSENLLEDIHAYPWSVDTKYYTAEVKLCSTSTRTIGNQEFAESVEAFVVYFDSEEDSSFEQVKSWLPFVKQIEPEVQLLVCQRCDVTSAVPRKKVQEWCVENSFELVEMSPEEEDNDEEDDFLDSFGIKRIIQSLQAHTWPNLTMKERPSIRSPYFQQLMKEQAAENASEREADPGDTSPQPTDIPADAAEGGAQEKSTVTKNCDKKPSSQGMIDSLLPTDDSALFEALGADDPDNESFEKLFENLKTMKEKSDQLPESDRKAYAEKIAVSFWKAMGGEEDEIANLSDSSQD